MKNRPGFPYSIAQKITGMIVLTNDLTFFLILVKQLLRDSFSSLFHHLTSFSFTFLLSRLQLRFPLILTCQIMRLLVINC